MKVEVKVEFSEEEQEVLTLLDMMHAAIMQANRAGVGEYSYLANMDGMYGKLEELFNDVAEHLLGYDMAKAMRESCLDSGESPSWVIKHHALHLLEKRGIY